MHRGSILEFAFGTEDFDFDRSGSRLLVSAQERRASEEVRGRRPDGAIWAVPVTPAGPGTPYKLDLVGRDGEPFHPVGLSLVEDGDERLLFVINRDDKSRLRAIEVFEVQDRALRKAREPLRSDLLRSPNDILAVSPDEIYVSNDAYAQSQLAVAIERVFRLARGSVVRYGSGTWSEVAGSIQFPNGLALSRDGGRLFVAATQEKRIRVYPRDRNGGLGPGFSSIDLPAHPDNLLWENDHHLNVACARSLWSLLRHRSSLENLSPSEVYRIDVSAEKAPRPECLFKNDGREISGGSTALAIGKRLYISQLMGNGIYVTDLL